MCFWCEIPSAEKEAFWQGMIAIYLLFVAVISRNGCIPSDYVNKPGTCYDFISA